MKIINVLNLGAGVGSTTVYLMMHRGDLPPVEAAVFADTGEEPTPVYEHLRWLQTLGSPRIIVAGEGKLGDDLLAGCVAAGQQREGGRFSSIPAFTAPHHEDRDGLSPDAIGRLGRQCTKDYKINVVDQVIRRQLLGLARGQRRPKDVLIRQHFGLSDDEGRRIKAVRSRFASGNRSEPVFPLATLGMTRADCVAYLEKHVPHEVPRSACTFCPYRDNHGWKWLRDNDPAGFARAVEIDHAIRDPTAARGRGLRQSLYLHRQCIPLDQVDVNAEAAREEARKTGQQDLFSSLDTDCVAGVCGV